VRYGRSKKSVGRGRISWPRGGQVGGELEGAAAWWEHL